MAAPFSPNVVQYIDGLESALSTMQTLATALNTYVDGLEAGQTTLGGKLDTLHADLDTVETKLQSLITGPLVVDTALVTAITYFDTADGRDGLMETYEETRDSDGLSRTITITRDTTSGSITAQSAGAWA